MSDFVYFVPDRPTLPREKVADVGLAYALGDSGPTWAAGTGPDGKTGCLVAFGSGSVSPSGVTWQQLPGGNVALGYDPASMPTLEDLARPGQVPSHPVRMADGQTWLVPVARYVTGSSALPCRLTWNGSTWLRGDVQAVYADLFAHACTVWDALMSGESAEITLTYECDLIVQALAVNYRLGPAEVSALGLLDTESERAALMALIDWPSIDALKKKGALDPPSSEPPETDS